MTVIDKIKQKQKAKQIELLKNKIADRLQSTWSDLEWDVSTSRIPEDEANDEMRWGIECFVAEQAFLDGVSKEDFLAGMAKAFDEVVENAVDEDEDEDEEEEEEEGEEGEEEEEEEEEAEGGDANGGGDVSPGVAALQDALNRAPPITKPEEPPKS